MNDKVNVVLFEGGNPSGAVEKMLVDVRHAVLLDNINKMQQIKEIGNIFLLTNYPRLAEEAAEMGVRIWRNNLLPAEFHFGKELSNLIDREKLKNVFYMGGASIPLVKIEELQEICLLLLNSEAIIYANNVQSADIVAFTPAGLMSKIEPPKIDNVLGISLRDGTGVEQRLLRNTAGLLFDLDTPADLLILAGSPFAGPRARKVLDGLRLDLSRLERAKEVLRGDYEEALLLGRVGAPVISHINQNLKLRLRVFSEERGMKALGREENRQAISLMGFFLKEVGIRNFFNYVEKVARCAFMDTRVLMVHLSRQRLATEERFLSDLGYWQEMRDPFMRDFTRAAVESEIPVLCGGHSLVLGGLWALVDEIGPTHNYGQYYLQQQKIF